MSEFLSHLFPDESAVPPGVNVKEQEQREYLVDGKLRTWNGALNPVYSTVFFKTKDGLKQKLIGRTPLLTSNEALEAMDAAVRAYDLGHGAWPMMSVTQRIEHVEKFLTAMRSKRWE